MITLSATFWFKKCVCKAFIAILNESMPVSCWKEIRTTLGPGEHLRYLIVREERGLLRINDVICKSGIKSFLPADIDRIRSNTVIQNYTTKDSYLGTGTLTNQPYSALVFLGLRIRSIFGRIQQIIILKPYPDPTCTFNINQIFLCWFFLPKNGEN